VKVTELPGETTVGETVKTGKVPTPLAIVGGTLETGKIAMENSKTKASPRLKSFFVIFILFNTSIFFSSSVV
jgi:hypothetical protein